MVHGNLQKNTLDLQLHDICMDKAIQIKLAIGIVQKHEIKKTTDIIYIFIMHVILIS